MEWTMSLLLNHPKVMKRVKEEIESHVGTSRLMEESDIPQLPFLQAIINETLRLFPPGPLVVRELSEDTTVGGYNIPRGTILFTNLWAIQRDETVWEDATKFIPERFLQKKGNGAMIEGLKFIPFGFGRRKCPGEAFAMKEIGLVLGTLIQCFNWEKVGGVEVDITDGHGFTIPKAIPLEALCKTRENMLPFLS
jgi:cytochrome P450